MVFCNQTVNKIDFFENRVSGYDGIRNRNRQLPEIAFPLFDLRLVSVKDTKMARTSIEEVVGFL